MAAAVGGREGAERQGNPNATPRAPLQRLINQNFYCCFFVRLWRARRSIRPTTTIAIATTTIIIIIIITIIIKPHHSTAQQSSHQEVDCFLF
jgi:hypothetical protein